MYFPENMTAAYFFFDTYPGYFLQALPIALLIGGLWAFRLRKIHSGKNYSPPDPGNRGPGYVQWGRHPYL